MIIDSSRTTRHRPGNAALLGGIVVAIASLLIFAIGLYTRSPHPVHCAVDPVICPSPRDEWDWATRDWFLGAFMLGVLVAWTGLVWRPISETSRLRWTGSVLGLLVLLPVTALLVFVAIVLANTTCDPNTFCFGGRQDALAVAAPAAYGAVLCLLMAIGLILRDDDRTGRVCGTLGLCLASGIPVLVGAGFVLSALGL